MITQYQFGSMVVDGKNYSHDLWISLKGEVKDWRRKEGHRVELEDLEEVIKENLEVIIVGTGAYGVVEVKKAVENWLAEKGIKMIAKPTGEAVREYNRLKSQKQKVVGLFHLTC